MLVAVLGIAYFTLPQRQLAANSSGTSAANQASTTGDTSTIGSSNNYTMTDVAKHNYASSCWAAINGNVYDLTSWISQHPGGPERILSICGTDGSAAFNGQHSGQAQPANELKNFLLGPLAS